MEGLTFEQAFEELEQIVQRLDAGDLGLDEMLALYERGQALARNCQEHLDRAELRVAQLSGDTQEPA